MPSNLELRLVCGDNVIIKIALLVSDWPNGQFETEFEDFELYFDKFSKVFGVLSNITRIKMLRKLLEEKDCTLNFAGFISSLDLNPKTVWEHLEKFIDVGFVIKTCRGTYQLSEFGQSTFLTFNFLIQQLLEMFKEI